MKLRVYQLCRWCDAAVHGRRKWLWLAGNVLALTLSALLGGVFVPVCSLALLANAVLALYLLHRHHAFGAAYQRSPRPQDAHCETILIDTSLIGQGTRLRAAAQPIDVADSLNLRLGSGTLLLGAAMTLTADELPAVDRSAILSAVQQLNIKPDRMRSHNPVLRREKLDDVSLVTVRDGLQERRYLLGSPEAVAKRCASIWEGSARPMTEHDHLRIADTARYITQGNCRVLAWATSLDGDEPIFLGMAGVGESLHLNAVQDVNALRNMGLTVMLDSGSQADTDTETLLALLELPAHHARADIHLTPNTQNGTSTLCVTRRPGDSLAEPIQMLRQRFSTMEATLRRFGLLLLFTLGIALPAGSWVLSAALTAMLLCAAILIGADLTTPAPRCPVLLISAVLAAAARLFLQSQAEGAILMASGMIAVAAALSCVIRLGGRGFRFKGEGQRISWAFVGAAGLLLLALVVYGACQGGSILLPLGFAVLIGAAVSLLMVFEQKILR